MQTEIATEICRQLNATLIRSLGAGAFKHAYLIERGEELFALKVAPVSGDLRARFEREITALRGCDHPAIAKILASDLVVLGGNEYWIIVEEYLSHGTLTDLAANTPLSQEDIRRLGITLAGALAHLSERKFVHRDIKPANILFRTPPEPVLTDFGIVRMLGEQSLTQDFMAQGPGTPMYAAPEQLLNEKCAIDWRTDQFGLALVLAEQLLGHHAYLPDNHSNVRDAVMLVANRQPLPTGSRDRLAAKGFGCLVKAMSPWPVQRFRRPDEFLRALTGGV